MATKLEKDIIRESTIKVDGRELLVTLSSKQEIRFKLKGMKSGELSIGMDELYGQLNGGVVVVDAPINNLSVIDINSSNSPMISLFDLRSLSAVSAFDLGTTIKFDNLLSELISNNDERRLILGK